MMYHLKLEEKEFLNEKFLTKKKANHGNML
jgi:hypothetical protein